MCKVAGPRCSHYAQDTLGIISRRHEKAVAELADYEEKYGDTLVKEEDLTKSDVIHQHKHQRLVENTADLEGKLEQAQFDYYSTPLGQEELDSRLAQAIAEGDEVEQKKVELILDHAKKHRQWQQRAGRELREIEEKYGPEAAREEALRREAELRENMEQTKTQLAEAEAERDRLEAELQENDQEIENLEDRVEKAEENIEELTEDQKREDEENRRNLELARRRKRNIMIAVAGAAAAVLLFQLVMQAATGKQSQMLGYAKSAATRRAVGAAQKHLGDLIGGGEAPKGKSASKEKDKEAPKDKPKD